MTDDALFDLDPRTHARRTDPSTSSAAATLLNKAAMMRRLLRVFAESPDGLTAEEASDLAGYEPAAGAWKRVSDLAAARLIADTPLERRARSGRYQQVRVITAAGIKTDRGETP